MAKRTYPAIFEPADGGWGVSFPDLPGCVSFGADITGAVRAAEEALSLHLEGMAEDSEPFPDAVALDQRMAGEPGLMPAGGMFAAITVEAPDEAERVNLYLPRSLLERIDQRAKDAGVNRSVFLGLAARAYMGESSQKLSQSYSDYDAWRTAVADILGARLSADTRSFFTAMMLQAGDGDRVKTDDFIESLKAAAKHG